MLDAGTADLTPSAGTLHSYQDLISATEIGRLIDASYINQRRFKALLLYVGLCAPSASTASGAPALHCSLREEFTQDRLRNSLATPP